MRESFDDDPLMYNQLANKETLAKARAVLDQGYESALSQLNDLTERMQPEAAPLAKMLARQASEAGNIEGAREIIATVAAKLTQAGQFGQAARILRDADPETFMLSISKQLKKLNQEGAKIYGKKWKDVDLTPEEIGMVNKIERGNQKAYDEALEMVRKRIANELPSSAMEKVNAWRHMAMLLNPKTQVRNIGGNVSHGGGLFINGCLRYPSRYGSLFLFKELPPQDLTIFHQLVVQRIWLLEQRLVFRLRKQES